MLRAQLLPVQEYWFTMSYVRKKRKNENIHGDALYAIPFNFAHNMHSKMDIMNKYAAIKEYYR